MARTVARPYDDPAMTQLSLAPQELDLELYAGDGVALQIVAKDAAGAAVNLTGTITAQIRMTKSAPGSPLLAFTVDSTNAATGILILRLTGAQTATLIVGLGDDGFRGYWDVQWQASGSEPTTLLRGIVLCDTDVSR
jgi:hypothetical protein